MFRIKAPSRWKFATSAGSSASFAFVAAGRGDIILTAPAGGNIVFHYASAGAGLSVGYKALGKPSSVNMSMSTTDFFSTGQIYLLDTFRGAELAADDIEGVCLIGEISAGAGIGASGTAMFLGIDPDLWPQELAADTIYFGMASGAGGFATDIVMNEGRQKFVEMLGVISGNAVLQDNAAAIAKRLETTAKAVLLMAGFNSGPQLTAGLTGSIGYLWTGTKPKVPMPIDLPVGPEQLTTRSSRSAREFALILPSDALFDFDKDNIKPSAAKALQSAGKLIQSHPGSRVLLSGHTDSIGDHAYNFGLSLRRAASVGHWLVSHGYIGSKSIMWVGMGKSKPIATNDTDAGRVKNRRVEIRILAGG